MKKLALAFILFIALCFSASALSKSDFVQKVETRVDITSAYTHYRVCNPTGTEYIIDSASDFGVDFIQASGSLKSFRILKLENISYEVDDYLEYCNNETIEVFTSEQNETPYVNVSYLNCSKEYLGKKTLYYMEWQEFTPVGNSFAAGECYDIRIEGTYNAATPSNPIAIDNIIEYADYTFEEYDWWNASWNNKKSIEIDSTALSSDTYYPLKIVLNSSNIDYADFQADGGDMRFVDSTETIALDYFIEVWNTSGNSIVYVNATITNSSTTTIYLYYNSSGKTNNSNFIQTFGSNLQIFLSLNADTADLAGNYDATNTNAIYTSYHNSIEQQYGAYDFDGSGDYLTTTAVSLVEDGDDYTICAWARRDGDSNDDRTSIFGNVDASNNGISMYVIDSDDTLKLWTGGEYSTSEVIGMGDVNHYCLSHDQSTNNLTVYLNASNIYSYIDTYTSTTDDNLEIGVMYDHDRGYTDLDWNGILDEFRLYNNVISENTIQLLHSQPTYTIGSEQSQSGTNANETEGRTAIETGVANALGSSYTTYTGQQVYGRYNNGSQMLGSFDKFIVYNSKRWAFNYDNESASGFTSMLNMTPTLYVLEIYAMTESDITDTIGAYINDTK